MSIWYLLYSFRLEDQLIKLMPKSHSFKFHVINVFRQIEDILIHGALIEMQIKVKKWEKLVSSTYLVDQTFSQLRDTVL